MRLLLLAALLALSAPASGFKFKSTKLPCECVDIAFLLDLSGSIDADKQTALQFICDFLSCFRSPPDDARFAVVTFAEQVAIHVNFDHPCHMDGIFDDCKDDILSIDVGEFTNLELGLEAISKYVFDVKFSGDRDDKRCPDLLIVMSDGISNRGGGETEIISAANKLKSDGVHIVTIGIDDRINTNLLTQIASEPGFFFELASFSALSKFPKTLKEIACDTIRFDPACQTCCCGVVHGDRKRNYPDWRNKCCGKIRYDPKKATCCQGKLHQGFNEHCTRCCNYQPYDPRFFTCCYGKVVPASRTQDQCCGYVAYNQKREICCYGWVFRKLNKHTQCCGKYPYTPQWQICCRYRVNEGCSYDYRCCGRRAYLPKHEICCDPRRDVVRPSPIKFCGKDITLPCGKTSWDPLWNTCCCGKVHPGAVDRHTGCCLYQRYNLDKQLCCDGRLINVDPELYQCCGRRAYDKWNQTCCHGYFVVNGKGTCCGYYKIFDHKHQICCGEKYVFDGHPCRTKCCYSYYFGIRPYDTKKQLCCLGNVQPGGKHWRCCRYFSYNLKTHMCCYGYIVPRSPFRLLNFCDNPFDRGYDENPSADLDPDLSVNEQDPTAAEAQPVIDDADITIDDGSGGGT